MKFLLAWAAAGSFTVTALRVPKPHHMQPRLDQASGNGTLTTTAKALVTPNSIIKPGQLAAIPTTSLDLDDYEADPNTDYFTVSSGTTVWVPQNTALVTGTITSLHGKDVITTITSFAVAFYGGPNEDINVVAAPSLRDNVQSLFQPLCVDDNPDGTGPAKRDEILGCYIPHSNLQGPTFTSVWNDGLDMLRNPVSLAFDEIPVEQAPQWDRDEVVQDVLLELIEYMAQGQSMPFAMRLRKQADNGCPSSIDCESCGGTDGTCVSPNKGCPCNSAQQCPNDAPPDCADPDCGSTDDLNCTLSSTAWPGCGCSYFGDYDVDTFDINWILLQQKLWTKYDDATSCPDNTWTNQSLTNDITIKVNANTGTWNLSLADYPELGINGTQWRFANSQGVLSNLTVMGYPASPATVDQEAGQYVTFELQPDTLWIAGSFVLSDDYHTCDIDVSIVLDGAANPDCGGQLADLPDPQDPITCPAVDQQEFTFYISDWWDSGTSKAGLMVVGMHNDTCTSQEATIGQYTATLSSDDLPGGVTADTVNKPDVGWRKYIPALQEFSLQGVSSGGICGLQTTFSFKNIGNNQFAFSDKGIGGQMTGTCQVIYPGTDLPGNAKYSEICQYHPMIFFATLPILGCWVPGAKNYCRDYGNPYAWIDVTLTNDDQSTVQPVTVDPQGACNDLTGDYAVFNDKLSFVDIPSGYQCTFWKNTGCKGDHTAAYTGLLPAGDMCPPKSGSSNWGQVISSFKCCPAGGWCDGSTPQCS